MSHHTQKNGAGNSNGEMQILLYEEIEIFLQ